MIDGYDRNIEYLRLSVTDLCNLKCKYCMPEKGIDKKAHTEILSYEACVEIVKTTVSLGVKKVRLTGGEPLVRRDIISLVQAIGKIDGIEELCMTTNGLLLKKYAKDLKEAGLSRVNISIDTLDPEKYKAITRGGNLQDVLAGIEAAKKFELFPIKLNIVVINGFNTDEIEDFINMASENVEVRFIELMPVGEASSWSDGKFISNENLRQTYAHLLEPCQSKHNGPAVYWKNKKTKGKVGFINPISEHFCSTCNRIRVTPDGKLKTCLHSSSEVDLKHVFKTYEKPDEQRDALKTIIQKAISNKPKQHEIGQKGFIPTVRSMNRIGG